VTITKTRTSTPMNTMTNRAALVLLLALGCKHRSATPDAGPPDIPPMLGPVAVNDLTPDEAMPAGVRFDTQALTKELDGRLRGSGVFAASAGDAGAQPVARVRVDFAVEEVRADDKAAARATVRFRVDTRPSGLAAQHWNEDVQAGGETVYPLKPEPDRKAVFAKLVARMLGDLGGGYLSRQRIWRGSEKDVTAALNVDAGEARVEAIHVAAERHLTSAVPTLLALLSNEDESVRDAALGALVEMRERRAVSEIAKQRSMRDQREMRKILDAIATLGGDEAMEYLSFVADAHEDEEIKQMAKQALERLKRRTATSQSGQTKPGPPPGP
jgi:hypothetical protein